jgi:chromosome segregation ATPase
VLSRDGSVDIKATLVSRSETVAPEELAARRRTLRVLQMSTVNSLIEEVVDSAVASLSRALRDEERQALIQEAKSGFVERFDALNAEKADLEARAADLERAREMLETERRAVIEAERFTVSDEGMLELEHRLGRLVDRAARDGRVSADAEQAMREVMTRLLDEERQKISERAREAHSDTIARLEHKVSRLATTLEEARHERDRAQERAAALEMSSGVVLGTVMTPGLAEDDPRRALKRSLLEDLVRDNHWLREQIDRRPAPRAS